MRIALLLWLVSLRREYRICCQQRQSLCREFAARASHPPSLVPERRNPFWRNKCMSMLNFNSLKVSRRASPSILHRKQQSQQQHSDSTLERNSGISAFFRQQEWKMNDTCLLPCCVPDFKFHSFFVQVQSFCHEGGWLDIIIQNEKKKEEALINSKHLLAPRKNEFFDTQKKASHPQPNDTQNGFLANCNEKCTSNRRLWEKKRNEWKIKRNCLEK